MKKEIISIIIAIALLAGGIANIVLGVKSAKEIKNFPSVTATVSDIDVEYTTDSDGTTTTNETVYVKYIINGDEYDSVLQYAPGGLTQGEELEAKYNPEKPDYITAATKGSSTIQTVVGAVIAVIGAGLFVKPIAMLVLAKKKSQ